MGKMRETSGFPANIIVSVKVRNPDLHMHKAENWVARAKEKLSEDRERAAVFYLRAYRHFLKAGQLEPALRAAMEAVRIFRELGRKNRALRNLRKIRKHAFRNGLKELGAEALLWSAEIEHEKGHLVRAIRFLKYALPAVQDPQKEARIRQLIQEWEQERREAQEMQAS